MGVFMSQCVAVRVKIREYHRRVFAAMFGNVGAVVITKHVLDKLLVFEHSLLKLIFPLRRICKNGKLENWVKFQRRHVNMCSALLDKYETPNMIVVFLR